ncbi:hypothetical protein IQ07DRAFT_678903 [Pyrenochaeta sp. DS3sAY3a]|nr:hypothetical protein IQ07DRAFT_678903 [Pyrenochaeta sp. DS3sAY3a]
MSTPPAMSEKPAARFMMDGIIHNLARKQRQLAQAQERETRARGRSPSTPMVDDALSFTDDSPEKTISDYFAGQKTPPQVPLRGILKSPTVHFPEELGPVPEEPQPSIASPTAVKNAQGEVLHSLHTDEVPVSSGPPPHPQPPKTLAAPPPPPPQKPPEPPTLFDITIEANEYLNEAAYKLYTKFIDELSEFVNQQGEVIRRRLAVQERRVELRNLREHVSHCDMLLMDYLREKITVGLSSKDEYLMKLFEDTQIARDLVGPKEAEYEPLEVDLGAEEHKLKHKYASLENKFEHFFRLNATSTAKQSIPSRIEYESSNGSESSLSRGDRGHRGPAQEPRELGMLYGAVIGEQVGIGQQPFRAESGYSATTLQGQDSSEKKDSMNQPSDAPDADESWRHRSNATADETRDTELVPDPSNIPIAGNIDITESQELQTSDQRMTQSLRGVESRAIVPITDLSIPYLDDLSPDPGLEEGNSLLLLEQQCNEQSIFSEYLDQFDNTRDRVNRWMLHQLRLSPWEIFSLRREVHHQLPDNPRWAPFVLSEWSNDPMGHGQTYYQGSIELDGSDGIDADELRDTPYPEPAQPTEFPPLYSPSTSISNVARAPTVSDLHDRTVSSQVDLLDTTLMGQRVSQSALLDTTLMRQIIPQSVPNG